MSEETRDILADVVAHATGSAGISEDAGLDQAVPDALADDIDDYDRQTEIRDAHLADDADESEQEARSDRPPRGRVPVGALQDERRMRQASEQRLAQLQAEQAQYMQQLQTFLAQQQQTQAAEQQVEFSDDPEKYVQNLQQQVAQLQASQQQQAQLQQFGQQLQSEMAVAAPSVTASEDAMREEVGGEVYDAAYRHVHEYAQAELQRMYPGAPPAMLAQLEQVAGVAFVQQCRLQGVDPARHIYQKAQALGFVAPGQRVPGQQRRAPDQQGKLTAKDIASMPQDQFDELFESMRKSATPMPF